MAFLNIHEVLDIIDKEFGYDFEGKDKEDHLISRKTWNKYVNEFFEEKVSADISEEEKTGDLSSYEDKIKGENRYTKYCEGFVKEVIDFRRSQLIKQFNSNRKTMIDHETINTFETLGSALGVEIEESIHNKRIPITQYKMEKEEGKHNVTGKEIENTKEQLLQIVIKQLIDMDKINYDVFQHIASGSLEYGLANPLEMIADIDGSPLGYKIDATKYLKENVKNPLGK